MGDGTCLAHSGVKSDVKSNKENIMDLWKAVGQMRAMFAVIMASTVGSLGMILWGVLSKKVGL